MEPGSDVYTRTAYRPLLAEDKPDEAPLPVEAGPVEAPKPAETDLQLDALLAAEPAELDDAQKAALKELSHVPEDAPSSREAAEILRSLTGVSSTPLKPIRKKGISPEVENYMKRMEASKGKKRTAREQRKEGDELPPLPRKIARAEGEGVPGRRAGP